MRDRLGLRAGSPLELLETPEGVTLKPSDRDPPLTRAGNFLVYTRGLPAGFDVVNAITDERETRDRNILGM